MKRILTACLSLGAALALAATAEAQDTSQAGAAPMPQDSAPTTQAQGDTLGGDSTKWGYPVDTSAPQNPPGYRGMERPVTDTTADTAGTGSDSTRFDSTNTDSGSTDTTGTGKSTTSAAPDTTLPGDPNPRQPETPEQRIHSDSMGADSSSS